jgi:hypothetical protein
MIQNNLLQMNKFIRKISAASVGVMCFYLITFSNAAAQTIIGFSIANATVTEKDTFSIALTADSLLTGKNIYAFRFGLSFNADYLEFLSIDAAGPVLASWGLPSFNNQTTGRILIAGAGTSPLSDSGDILYLKFRAIRGGATYVQNIASESYLNEGSPGMTLKSGYIQCTALSYPDIYPDSYTLYVGEELQMNVSGGTAPYVYYTTDTAIAVITDLTRVKAKRPGLSKVYVVDASGEASYTSGVIDVRAIKLSIVRSSAWPDETFLVPVRIEIAPGTSVFSGSFELGFGGNIEGIKESVIQGDFPVSVQNNASSNLVRVSFASGSGFTGSGILCYIGFRAVNSGMHNISITNALFNESFLALTYNEYAEIYSLPTLSISPDGGNMMWGSTQKITVTNGTPPYTFETSDTAIATIDALGNLYGNSGGKVKVIVTDSHGATQTSNDFLIYHNQFSVKNTDGILDNDTRVPITTTLLPPGKAVYSFEGTLSFNPTYLEFVRIEPGIPGMIVESVNTDGTLNIVGASATGISNGPVCYLIFRIQNTLGLDQQTNVTLINFVANESDIYSTLSSGMVKRVAQVSYRPVAVAGANIRVNEGETVTLDGSASFDDDNDPLTYSWSSPAGIQLNDSTLIKPQFIAPLVNVNTNYVFTLVVNDGESDSDPSSVTVTVLQINSAPVANAGPDKSITEGSTVSLDGGSSYDPDGEAIFFQWTSVDGIVLFDPKSSEPSFIAPQVSSDTDYRFRLIVGDGIAFSKPDTVVITVLQVNKKPIAFAGGDQTVSEGALVYLDGSLSSDPDGNTITFLWTAPSNVVLSSRTIPKPTFIAPPVHLDSTLTISLVVNDGSLNSETDNVLITVKNIDILSHESQITNVELPLADSIKINQTALQVILYMPYGADTRALSPTFTISDKATISPMSGTIHNFTSPVTYTVTAEDGTTITTYQVLVYVPDLSLSRILNAGWNWISLGVDLPNTNLGSIFSELSLTDLDYVKSTKASSVYYTGTGWFGDLVAIPENELVKFKKATSQTFTLTGKELNPTLTYVPVTTGWNWIGFLLKDNSALGSSFDEATLPSGDLLIKSKEASAVYYPASGWIGDLDSLKVLNGYMLKSSSNANINYAAGGIKQKSSDTTANLFERDDLYKIYDVQPSYFEYSANLIGEIVNENGEIITQKGDLLIAYVGGECRGVTEACYISDLERYLFIITIFSNSTGQCTFQVKSPGNKNGSPLIEYFVFDSDEVFGAPFKPVQFHLSKSDIIRRENLPVEVYPNPVSDQLNINSESEISRISIYNSLGTCIRILTDVSGNTQHIHTSDLASGFYILRIETKTGVEIIKLIKSKD